MRNDQTLLLDFPVAVKKQVQIQRPALIDALAPFTWLLAAMLFFNILKAFEQGAGR